MIQTLKWKLIEISNNFTSYLYSLMTYKLCFIDDYNTFSIDIVIDSLFLTDIIENLISWYYIMEGDLKRDSLKIAKNNASGLLSLIIFECFPV